MDTKLELTERAMLNITAMQERVNVVQSLYGPLSDEHQEMLRSLLHALIGMIRLGGRISAEDDLSLYGVTPHIHYGVNFSPERNGDRRDPVLGSWSINS